MTTPTVEAAPHRQQATTRGAAPTTPEPADVPAWPGHSITGQALARATQPGYHTWLEHVRAAAGCTRPVRLSGHSLTLDTDTGRLLTSVDTASMPDGVIYKACGNRRHRVCPSCSRTYQYDAYQLIRAGITGGKGIPDTVASHPAVFATLTAPSFGPVHTRHITRHTCHDRRRCDCRPEPCHARRDLPTCPHGHPASCWARHQPDDPQIGQPLCCDCYDHPAQVVWNHQAGELWRRTTITITRHIRRRARQLGIPAPSRTIRVSYGKTAEYQTRGVVHYHAIIRLDGRDPSDPDPILPPPAGLQVGDLVDAIEHAAATVTHTTDPHPTRPDGWPIRWGHQVDVRPITLDGDGQISDTLVAGYLAKYATKSTETTGHQSTRLDHDTIDLHADPTGTHTERLIDACWTLGGTRGWTGLRRWAHMLGFGGHFLTKSRRYSITFRILRDQRIIYRRTEPPADVDPADAAAQETTLVIGHLRYTGAGWHTTGDALLANTAAALARERHDTAREELAHETGTLLATVPVAA